MFNKHLFLKYGFLFLCILIAVAVVDYFKVQKIQTLVQNEIEEVQQHYNAQLQSTYEKIDLIFESAIVNNKQVHALLERQIHLQKKQEAFNQLFEKELLTFKAYSIDAINIYDKSFTQDKIIARVIKEYQPYKGFDFINSEIGLRVIKPIFDKQMTILGVVEFKLNVHHILYQVNQTTPYTMRILYANNALEAYMSKRQLKSYEHFENNAAFMYQPSVYDDFEKINNIYYYAFANQTDEMIAQMQTYKHFASSFTFNDSIYDLVMIPLVSQTKAENIGYIFSYHQNEHLSEIMQNHKVNTYAFCIIFFIMTCMAYTIHWFKLQKVELEYELEQFKKDIDKYVIMTETDNEGIIRYVSQAFCNISGYKKEDLIGRPQNVVRHPDISKEFFKNMWKQLNDGKTWEGEIKNIDKNGNSYWIRGIIIPIMDKHNKIKGFRSIRVNITDEKQLEKVNSILKDDLSMRFNEIKRTDKGKLDESKIELMGKMLDAFANEWKKPISSISIKSLDLETRLKSSLPNKEYLQEFTQEINDLVKLLSNNLNKFKYIFHNKSNEKYNVYNEVEHAIYALEVNDNVSIHFQGEKDLYTFGIAHDLKQIVESLLNNAIEQFEIKNIENAMISVNVYHEDEDIFVTVKDNALGIPEDIRNRIFEPDFSTKVDLPSKGLSLYISKLMLQRNGGDLNVESIEGGSRFIIRLISKDRRQGLR